VGIPRCVHPGGYPRCVHPGMYTLYTLGTPYPLMHPAHAHRYTLAGMMRSEECLGSVLRLRLGMRRREASFAQECDSW